MAATLKKGAKPSRREYSDAEKAAALAALAANGGNVAATAKQLGIPRKTLAAWAKGECKVPPDAAEVRHQKKDLAARLEEVAWNLADAIPGKIDAATLVQTATSLGIALDKMQLLRGKPTSISGQDLTDDERAKRIAAILDAARSRRARAANGQLDAAAVGAAGGPANPGV